MIPKTCAIENGTMISSKWFAITITRTHTALALLRHCRRLAGVQRLDAGVIPVDIPSGHIRETRAPACYSLIYLIRYGAQWFVIAPELAQFRSIVHIYMGHLADT